jgi:uncharacterized protein (TIGR02145 family)
MKSSKFFNRRELWSKSFYALLPGIFLVIMSSCQKAGFEDEKYAAATLMNAAALEPSDNAIMYYGAETFKIVSKYEPLVETRTLTNPDYKYFQKFMLKVKNGNGNSNKDVNLEILIDDVVVMTSADFTKGRNIVLKELPALTAESVLEVRLEGAKNKSVTLLIECSLQENVITDVDGNYYKTVKIGDQWWMAENLKVTKLNDGTPIPNVTDDAEWKGLMLNHSPAYCWYDNNPEYKEAYGGLYSRGAVENAVNVCPVGWHIPDIGNDCMVMFSFINPEIGTEWAPGMYIDDIGNMLMEAGTSHWNCIEHASTNETGFTALPGGWRTVDRPQAFYRIGNVGIYWGDGGYAMYIFECEGTISLSEGGGEEGFSVRCVKD